MKFDLLNLRPATEADSEFCYDVKKQALGHYVAQVWGWDEAFQRDFHRADFVLRRPDVVVYRDLDIGTIEINRGADHIHLGEFYLLPQFQRQGIGTVLLGRVLDEAREKYWPVRLEVLKNNPVRSLYLRHGFVITGEREHHFWMERAVPSHKHKAVEPTFAENRSFPIENDDYPIFALRVESIGEQQAEMFAVLRQIMRLSPAEAKQLLSAQNFEVSRGPHMELRPIQEKLERAGAKTRLVVSETDLPAQIS